MIPSIRKCWTCGYKLARWDNKNFCSSDCGIAWKNEVGFNPASSKNSSGINRKLGLIQRWGWYECWSCNRMFFKPAYLSVGGPDDRKGQHHRRKEWVLLPDIKGPICQVHHIHPEGEGGTDEVRNLSLVCNDCHIRIHQIRNNGGDLWYPIVGNPVNTTSIGRGRINNLNFDIKSADQNEIRDILNGNLVKRPEFLPDWIIEEIGDE